MGLEQEQCKKHYVIRARRHSRCQPTDYRMKQQGCTILYPNRRGGGRPGESLGIFTLSAIAGLASATQTPYRQQIVFTQLNEGGECECCEIYSNVNFVSWLKTNIQSTWWANGSWVSTDAVYNSFYLLRMLGTAIEPIEPGFLITSTAIRSATLSFFQGTVMQTGSPI